MQGIELALGQTVAANHTTRIIDLAGLEVNGAGLAVFLAESAMLAFFLVKIDAKYRDP